MEMVELVCPAAEVRERRWERALGLPTLEGRRAALLSNGKWNADALLGELAALLQRRHGVEVSLRLTKQRYNHELGPDAREEVLAAADFALVAIGD
ncbi:MAG TPA: hypothetical protein VKY90_01655 [Candidatus Dormibacteraeota bacterium]|nr:hypothetical protein [Candidatus Dormibacteraeota bacterium]